LTLEAAVGLALQDNSFTPDWPGYVGDGGLIYREFAARMGYRHNGWLEISSTFGTLRDWEKTGDVQYMKPPDTWGSSNTIRKYAYSRPTVRLSLESFRLDLGAVLLIETRHVHNRAIDFHKSTVRKSVFPAFGVELGESDGYLYAGFLNSFPLVSGGGAIEFGIAGKSRGIYEHKAFFAMGGYQALAIGYRGEFRVYRNTAIAPGFSLGGSGRDNIYVITFGIKSLIDL
jgi:hypothetical protein